MGADRAADAAACAARSQALGEPVRGAERHPLPSPERRMLPVHLGPWQTVN